MKRNLLCSWGVTQAGERSVKNGWVDLTHKEVEALLARVEAGAQLAHAFKMAKIPFVKGEGGIEPSIAIRAIRTYMKSPLTLKPEVTDIVGSLSDGLTVRQIAAMNDCATAIEVVELFLGGKKKPYIARHLGCEAQDVGHLLASLGYASSSWFKESTLLSIFDRMDTVDWAASGNEVRFARIILRRANSPSRDWGSVVVNNGFKVANGKIEGDVVEVVQPNQCIGTQLWRVIPVSIPTLEEAVETILEWGFGL